MKIQSFRQSYEVCFKACSALKQSISYLKAKEADEDLHELMRDAVVKRFEFTYEAFTKLMFNAVNYLEEKSADSPKHTWVTAVISWHQMGLGKAGRERYEEFKRIRNLTTHTYDENPPDKLIDGVVEEFYLEVKSSLERIEPNLPINDN